MANRGHKLRISMPNSRVAAYVIMTDLMIARHARARLRNDNAKSEGIGGVLLDRRTLHCERR